MSFLSNPDRYSFAPVSGECLTCDPTGETPEILFLSLEGVKIGNDWISSNPPPPNGLVQLNFVGACQWVNTDPPYSFVWTFAPGDTSLVVFLAPSLQIFIGSEAISCNSVLDNDFTTPGGKKYYSGRAVVTAPLGDSDISNPDRMDLLNVDPFDDFWVNYNPAETGKFSNGYFLAKDSTNVLIKYDLT